MKLSNIPKEIIQEYNLCDKATPDGWVYAWVVQGMYGLPQVGSNSHDELQEWLNKEGYFQSQIVPGLWRHKTCPTLFALVVDDFAIKYFSDDDLEHLIKTLRQYYDVTVDYEGKEFLKMELDWDYENNCVHLSMAPYLKKELAHSMWKNQANWKIHHSHTFPPNMEQSSSLQNKIPHQKQQRKIKNMCSKSLENSTIMPVQLMAQCWHLSVR